MQSEGVKAERITDELFAVAQLVESDSGLRSALGEPARSASDRADLLGGLVDDQVLPATAQLVRQAVVSDAGPVVSVLGRYQRLVAAAQDEMVAVVRSARELSDAEQGRISTALSRQYATTVHLHLVLDPELIGGLRVEIGDDVIDGSVSNRLDDARRKTRRLIAHRAARHPRTPTHTEGRGITMTELSIRPDEIRDALAKYVEDYKPSAASKEEVGVVSEAGDGIARVTGLPSAMANELLEFEDGTRGLALNLDTREIGVVILGDFDKIEEGQTVRRTGEVLSVPVGDKFLGRVIDPLGTPIDGLGDIEAEGRRALELQAPTVMQRKSVHEPLATGIKAIDSLTPIGRGQRQLVIGDRATGKTTVCVDTIINQKQNWETGDPDKQVRCIYVAVGQKGSTIASVRGALEEAGALEYTTIVASPASDSAGFKYLAPYTGSAIGQHWMYDGKHVLIVFDDLSKQAEAYRSVSLLLRRPPGREAYPGDVFYLHSRLLERCAKLSDDLGHGSMTGLPIIETKANDVSAFIPTNVISITDGQIFLQSDLFAANQRPAIDVGISVSRVGGAAMTKAMKRVTGSLKVDLAQFRAMEAFAMFASDLDAASRQQLDRGGQPDGPTASAGLLAVPAGGDDRLPVDRYVGSPRRGADRRRAALRERVPRLPAPLARGHPRRDP